MKTSDLESAFLSVMVCALILASHSTPVYAESEALEHTTLEELGSIQPRQISHDVFIRTIRVGEAWDPDARAVQIVALETAPALGAARLQISFPGGSAVVWQTKSKSLEVRVTGGAAFFVLSNVEEQSVTIEYRSVTINVEEVPVSKDAGSLP